MKQRNKQDIPKTLEDVRRDFENWRRQRRKGARIPEPLWAAAAGLVAEYGLSRVGESLRLDYYKLKGRSEPGEREPPIRPEPGVLFAELSEPAPSAQTVCVVELEKGNGTRMRLTLAQCAAVDWDRLTDAFLRA